MLNRTCKLKVADRVSPIEATYGVFHQNTLGLKVGLWHPELSGFLVSVYRQKRRGNGVHFGDDDIIDDRRQGKIHHMFWVYCLPRMELQFGLGDSGPMADVRLAAGAAKISARNKFLQHVRNAHFFCESEGKVCCPACSMMKDHGGVGHRNKRPVHLKPTGFLEQENWNCA